MIIEPEHPSEHDDDAKDEGTAQEELTADDLKGFVKDPEQE